MDQFRRCFNTIDQNKIYPKACQMKATVKALIARGCDSKLAKSLSKQKHTVASLKHLSVGELVALGIKKAVARNYVRAGALQFPTTPLTRCCTIQTTPAAFARST